MDAFAYNPLRFVESLSIRLLREADERTAVRSSVRLPLGEEHRPQVSRVGGVGAFEDRGNQLMYALQAGDAHALQQLFGLYNGRLFNFILRILGDAATAEDVVQETWLALYERRDDYQPTYRFSTWIFTIARRKALSELRRRKVRSIVRSLTVADPDHRGDILDLPQGTFEAPDASAEGAMLNTLVERALAILTDSQREIVILRDIEGFDNDEIARILHWNLKPGAIRKRVFDAREAFRRAMIQLGYREE